MKFRIITALLLTVCISAPAASSTNATAVPPVKKRYIVTMNADASPDAFVAQRNMKPRKMLPKSRSGFAANLAGDEALIYPRLKMVICDLSSDEAQIARKDSGVLAVEEDGPVGFCAQTNSTGIVRLGIDQFPVAHINGITEPLDVDVVVMDTGIDPHTDLNVFHFYCPFTDDPKDELGHGTHVAGIIGALDNEFGVVGIAPGVRLWNLKMSDATHNNWSYTLGCMGYCIENADQIEVANMSFGNVYYNAPFNSLRSAVRQMVAAGIVVVAGAGNSTNDLAGPDGVYGPITGSSPVITDDFVPAALPEAMAVSAMNPIRDTLTSFSNFSQIERTNGYTTGATNRVFSSGGAIDVAAPGNNILSTYTNGSYAILSGTSMAAPHVAGLVALYIAANGRATNAEGVYRIRQAIVDASLPQSQWSTNNTHDPDTNPEPLAIASEAWIPKPNFTNVVPVPGNYQASFAAVPGYDYAVQTSTNLTDPGAWQTFASVTGSNFVTTATATDTNLAAQKFYRLQRSPAP